MNTTAEQTPEQPCECQDVRPNFAQLIAEFYATGRTSFLGFAEELWEMGYKAGLHQKNKEIEELKKNNSIKAQRALTFGSMWINRLKDQLAKRDQRIVDLQDELADKDIELKTVYGWHEVQRNALERMNKQISSVREIVAP